MAGALAGCHDAAAPISGIGDPDRGALLVSRHACGACHEIPHMQQASGLVGPPLGNVGSRTVLAGYLPNTPENLARWIKSPQAIAPGNAMPDMHLSERDSRDIAAFLETLR
jgi:cytochrome c1